MDPKFKETVKALSVLDGTFVLDSKGRVFAPGRYLLPSSTKNRVYKKGKLIQKETI